MELTGWDVIVPLAVASLLTGLVMALGTKWGLFRHYWVPDFIRANRLCHRRLAHAERQLDGGPRTKVEGARLDELGGDLFHPGIGLVVLLVIQVLNLYKPPGMTRYGWAQAAGAAHRVAAAGLNPHQT